VPKTKRQAELDRELDLLGAPQKSTRFEGTCLGCGKKYPHWATVARCAVSHGGGGRVEVRLG
jgi:hypothetical protein